MRYLLLLHGDEAAELALPDEQRMAIVEDHGRFTREIEAEGHLVGGEPLGPAREGRIVRDGVVTDGPFAETKEQLGGYYLVEAASMDEAVAIAHRIPRSPGLAVEVREIPSF